MWRKSNRHEKRRLVPISPPPSSAGVTAAMRGNRRTDTKPEWFVRRLLYSLGYRYRLHAQSLPGKPDIIFSRKRCAIQVRGCFWHQHPSSSCPLRSRPRSNTSYWNAKLDRNVARDRERDAQLRALGWRVLTIWECECNIASKLGSKLERFLGLPATGARSVWTSEPVEPILKKMASS